METIKSLTGKWIGNYILGPEFELDEGKSFDFTLELIENDGDIEGICIEPGISEIFDKPITVNGFISDSFLSFTKQYPYMYYYDEFGKIIMEKDKPHPEISYSGEFDFNSDSFIGEFEMVVDSINYGEGWLEDILRGTWTLKRLV